MSQQPKKEYEVLGRFWVKGDSQEQAEKSLTEIFDKVKAELKNFNFKLEVIET